MAAVLSDGKLLMGAVMVVMIIAATGAETQSTRAPSYSASSCRIYKISLSSCVRYIENINNASLTPPPQSCCTALDSVLKTKVCLCQLYSNVNNPLGFPLNQRQALALDLACNIKTSSFKTQCKVSGGPSTDAVASPDSSPATPTSRAGGRVNVYAWASKTRNGTETRVGSGPTQFPCGFDRRASKTRKGPEIQVGSGPAQSPRGSDKRESKTRKGPETRVGSDSAQSPRGPEWRAYKTRIGPETRVGSGLAQSPRGSEWRASKTRIGPETRVGSRPPQSPRGFEWRASKTRIGPETRVGSRPAQSPRGFEWRASKTRIGPETRVGSGPAQSPRGSDRRDLPHLPQEALSKMAPTFVRVELRPSSHQFF
eukprot:Gb_02457 [translate_table: standard]